MLLGLVNTYSGEYQGEVMINSGVDGKTGFAMGVERYRHSC